MSEQRNSDQALPLVNRPETVIGTAVTFLVVAWCAALLRFWVRWFQGPKLLWWDDVLLLLACLSTTAGSVITCLLPSAGMGRHFADLNYNEMTHYFKYVYSSNITYATSATLIKLSILLQYLRLFDMNVALARRLTYGLFFLVASWGLTFLLIAIFSCHPIALTWDLTLKGHCIMFGSKEPDTIFRAFASHIGSNVFLDSLVFCLPIPFLKDLRMSGKRRIALIGLFTMGATVVCIALARLIAFCISYGSSHYDLTYYASQIYILAVLEINIAILCASIPIFWPVIQALTLGKSILVVNEITVHSTKRTSHPAAPLHSRNKSLGADSELGVELGRRVSQESGKRLARSTSGESDNELERSHYQDRYVQEWVVPDFDKGPQTTTTVERAQIPVPEDFVSRALKTDF